MSFDVICSNCGAPSSPAAGICPFCKKVMLGSRKNEPTTASNIRKYYQEGDLENALETFDSTIRAKPETEHSFEFLLLGAKILLESEGPTSRIKSLLGKALLLENENPECLDYLELLDARRQLTSQRNDPGEKRIASILRRSPNNVHALFIMGSHVFWVDKAAPQAIPYLQKCVAVRPQFQRAWGCLAVIYESLGQKQLAHQAYRKCLDLEKNPSMRSIFETKMREIQ